MDEEFPVYESGDLSGYIELVKTYHGKGFSKSYNIILKLLNRWLKYEEISIKGLCDIKSMPHKVLPGEDRSKKILKDHADKTAETLGIKYKYDKKKIKKHYKKLGKKQKKHSLNRSPAHDPNKPFRSEMINFIRKMLDVIDYKLLSSRYKGKVFWKIIKNKQLSTKGLYNEYYGAIGLGINMSEDVLNCDSSDDEKNDKDFTVSNIMSNGEFSDRVDTLKDDSSKLNQKSIAIDESNVNSISKTVLKSNKKRNKKRNKERNRDSSNSDSELRIDRKLSDSDDESNKSIDDNNEYDVEFSDREYDDEEFVCNF